LLYDRFQKPLPPCNLAAFRIVFGLLMVWEATRYWQYGRIEHYYMEVVTTFPYEWFPFVKPLPGDGMFWVFGLWCASAALMALGVFTRFSCGLLFVLYTYVFLIDKTQYNNHYYLISLLLFLMVFVDSDRCWSLSRLLKKEMPRSIPAWQLDLFRFQWALVYFYAGVAKLNVDWLAGQPVGTRIQRMGGIFLHEEMTFLYAYGGLLFDLFVGPLLLWKPTRGLAMVACLGFHLTNAYQLNIGVFPWLGMGALVLFFDPWWLARVSRCDTETREPFPMSRALTGFLVFYIAVQVLVPLRHWLYPGDVAWTDRGHRFAWRMKLRGKRGDLKFFLVTPDRSRMRMDTKSLLSPRQLSKMKNRPDMIFQFVQGLPHHSEWGVEIESEMRLNYRLKQTFVKPGVDLRRASWSPLEPVEWLEPLSVPRTPVSLKIEQYRRALALFLSGLVGVFMAFRHRGKDFAVGLSALVLLLAWPSLGWNPLWSVLGGVLLLGVSGLSQAAKPTRNGTWLLLFESVVFVVVLTALIAPFYY
jgi:vitamin K-dependent gamma-carboxylase